MARIACVAVEKALCRFDRLYSYQIPTDMPLQAGCRVLVPFGRGRDRMGLVVEIAEGDDTGLKSVRRMADSEPLLNAEGLMLLRRLREDTFCTWFEALSVLLPAGYGIRPKIGWSAVRGTEPDNLTGRESEVYALLLSRRAPASAEEIADALGLADCSGALEELAAAGLVKSDELLVRRVRDAAMKMVRLTGDYQRVKTTPRQRAVIELLEQAGCASVREVCYFSGVGKSVVDRLEKAGAVEYYEEEIFRSPLSAAPVQEEPPAVLSPEQAAAFETLARGMDDPEGRTALLYGVTGSGKTQVFMALMDKALAAGQGVLVMVPEIALTPQVVDRFRRRYGRQVAVLHSGLSLSQRLDEYKRVRQGLARVVIGTRSAVFAPVEKLGLIVIDEEQEHTYKSEAAPRYDARQIAQLRTRWNRGLLVLSSATPSVESYYRAQKGEYILAVLAERFGQAKLPDVTILDMSAQEIPCEGLSLELCQEIYYNLQNREQTILLMNRRGYSTQAACISCHTPLECPNCSISMKYHAANGRLMCHYCGHSEPLPKTCPRCGSAFLRYTGLGTQKVEQELAERFPQVRILRMDMDTTLRKDAHQKMLAAFAAGEYDILLGTQMVAKGLDFPGVTLVGVLGVDQMLYSDDFRSFERTFSLLTQVVGRCGRDILPGRAFIQTWSPENPILRLAAAQKYDDFYREEIQSRKIHLYPPFCRMSCIGVTGEDQQKTLAAAKAIAVHFSGLLRESYPALPVRLLGPSPGAVLRVAGRYRYKLLMKTSRSPDARRALWALLLWAQENLSGVSVFIDPDYDSF